MRSSSYTIIFATVVSALLSIMLSGVSMLLKEKQDENRLLEKQMSVLSAAQISSSSKAEVKKIYSERVKPMVIDKDGREVSGIDPLSVDYKDKNHAVLYAITKSSDDNQIMGYVYPVVGSGLWSKLYGYLAVDPLGKKILGLTFFNHGETPGLGAEIEKPWFTENFIGKSLFDKDKLVGVRVAKGASKLDKEYKDAQDRLVDGISGASITSDGVSAMLRKDPKRYENFFKPKREN